MIDLKRIRQDAGMTQDELADKVCLSRHLISNIERGIQEPSVNTAKSIAKELNFVWWEFFEDDLPSKMERSVRMAEIVYTVDEVAKLLKVNVNRVHKLRKSGKIKFMKLGSYKVRKQELDRFLAEAEGYDVNGNEYKPLYEEE